MELVRRSVWVYGLLTAVWALVAVWQAQEHYRVREAAKNDLSNRSKDIANTVSACIRGMRYGGTVRQERLESVLQDLVNGHTNELVKASELISITLLNAGGEPVASARGPPLTWNSATSFRRAFAGALIPSPSSTRQLAAGETLCAAGDEFDGAYLVAAGRLLEKSGEGPPRQLTAGDVLGEMQLLTGGRRSQTVVALEPSRLLLFAPDRFRSLVAGDEPLLETLSSLASERLRDAQLGQILLRLFGPLDDAVRDQLRRQIDWLELEPGETLFRQADPGDALYALIDGRLAAFAEGETGSVFLNEILPGETIDLVNQD